MPKSSRWGYAGEQMPYIDRDRAREKSRSEADVKSGSWNSKSSSWGDEAYMKELGKAGIRRQQERMHSTAEDETSRLTKRRAKRTTKRR